MQLDFRIIVEGSWDRPLDHLFAAYWPAYRSWMRRAPHTQPAEWRRQLHDHMPELVEPHAQLCARFGGAEDVARFLSMVDPPRVVRACTQLVIESDAGPRLIRSYDHHPDRFDGVITKSRWTGTETLAVTDCLWGALDGINEHGLTIALAFGGRRVIGPGFAAPMICRYVLETCSTLAEARETLARLPVYMAYTFVVVDANGDFVTAFLNPDRPASFVTRRASANHQGQIEWPSYATFSGTADRLACAESLITDESDLDAIRRAFLSPPLWRRSYNAGSGTLYVAEYVPREGTLTLHWPNDSIQVSLAETHPFAFAVAVPAAPVA